MQHQSQSALSSQDPSPRISTSVHHLPTTPTSAAASMRNLQSRRLHGSPQDKLAEADEVATGLQHPIPAIRTFAPRALQQQAITNQSMQQANDAQARIAQPQFSTAAGGAQSGVRSLPASPMVVIPASPIRTRPPISTTKSPVGARSPWLRGAAAVSAPVSTASSLSALRGFPTSLAKPASRVLSPVRSPQNVPNSGLSPHVDWTRQHSGLGDARRASMLSSPQAGQADGSMEMAGMDPSEEWLVPHSPAPRSGIQIGGSLSSAAHAAKLPGHEGAHTTPYARASSRPGENAEAQARGHLAVQLPAGLSTPAMSATPALPSSSPPAQTFSDRGTSPGSLDMQGVSVALAGAPTTSERAEGTQPVQGMPQPSLSTPTAADGSVPAFARPSSAISRMRARALASAKSGPKSGGSTSESSTPRTSPTAGSQGQQAAPSPHPTLSGSSPGGSIWKSADRSADKGRVRDKENLAPDFMQASDDSVNMGSSAYG